MVSLFLFVCLYSFSSSLDVSTNRALTVIRNAVAQIQRKRCLYLKKRILFLTTSDINTFRVASANRYVAAFNVILVVLLVYFTMSAAGCCSRFEASVVPHLTKSARPFSISTLHLYLSLSFFCVVLRFPSTSQSDYCCSSLSLSLYLSCPRSFFFVVVLLFLSLSTSLRL